MASICFNFLYLQVHLLLKHPISSIWHLHEVTRESMMWCYLWKASKVWNLGRRIWIQFVGSSKRTGQEILVASLEYASWSTFWTKKKGRWGLLDCWSWWFGTSMFSDVFTEGHLLVQCLCWIGFWPLRLGMWWCGCVWFWTYSSYIPPPKFNSSPLKNGGWKTILSYWVLVTLQWRTVKLLNFGRVCVYRPTEQHDIYTIWRYLEQHESYMHPAVSSRHVQPLTGDTRELFVHTGSDWYFSTYGCFENRGTPKSSILIRFSILNLPCWGTPIFGNIHITKIHDAFQVSVYTSLNLGLLILFRLITSRVFQNLTWPSQNVPGGWVGDPPEKWNPFDLVTF